MKCLLLADDRLDLLATLEPVLKHWGYRVLTATSIPQANAFLAESAPALLIIGSHLLAVPELQLPHPALPVLALDHPQPGQPIAKPDATLNVPVDIFTLFSFIQDPGRETSAAAISVCASISPACIAPAGRTSCWPTCSA